MEGITLPSNVSEIGISAFYNCSSLTSITIPSQVDIISNSTFQNCSSLKTVTILSTRFLILGDNAFMGLPADSIIYVPNETVKSEFVDGTSYDSTKTTISIK